MHDDVRRCGLRKGRKNKYIKKGSSPLTIYISSGIAIHIDYITTRDFSHNKVESPDTYHPTHRVMMAM